MTKDEIQQLLKQVVEKSVADAIRRPVPGSNTFGNAPSGALRSVVDASLFDALMANDAFKHLADAYATRGRGTDIGPIALKGFNPGKNVLWAPIVKYTQVSSDFPQQRLTLRPPDAMAPRFRMRDVIPLAGLAGTEVAYSRLVGADNSAGGVAEGAAKPESGIDVDIVISGAKTIATWIPASRQAAHDVAGFASWLNNILGGFLANEEDDQILNGAGGNELSGLLNDAAIQSQAVSTDTRLDAIRKAITKVQNGDPVLKGGWQPTALVMNPNDWEDVELSKDGFDRYLMIPFDRSPADGADSRVWALPVVVTPAIAAGTALLGAFDVAATLWLVEDATIRITDSHDDFFTKNKIAVLAEERAVLALYLPKALCKITGL